MEQSCSQSDLRRTPQTTEEKRKCRNKRDRVSTGQKIEQGMLLVAATEVVSHHTRLLSSMLLELDPS